MARVSIFSRLGWAFVVGLLLPSTTAADAGSLVVQQIGEDQGRIVEAFAAEAAFAGVTIVPFARRLDARVTPIILATSKAFLSRQGNRVLGLRPAERRAIQRAYDAGQVILLLDASTHDVEALHVLLEDGVAHQSSTDPVVLAYALRRENGVPLARLVTHPVEDDFGEDLDEDELDEDDLALSLALEIVIEELTRPPAVAEDVPAVGNEPDWGNSPVQKFVLTSTDNGIYNTSVDVYALHACDENKDYYLFNTGGDWTATQARYESAHALTGSGGDQQIHTDAHGNLQVDWQANNDWCTGGIAIVGFSGDQRICRYANYPLSYEVDIVPPSGPTVVQVNAAPAGDQGVSRSYETGFSFSISGGVEVSGEGPSGGLQAGVSWNNSVSVTVPPLAIDAGIKGNEGTFTTYRYCTVGSDPNCTSTIQMTGAQFTCQNFVVGQPQNGQTPNGRLSNVAQTVYWRVDPATYAGATTFDVTVTWQAELTTSTSYLWTDGFIDSQNGNNGPTGMCNTWGCSCSINSQTTPLTVSQTFKVPRPSSSQCPS